MEYRAVSMSSIRSGLQRTAITVALALMVVVLWLTTHRYPGIDNDAQVYAFQALARLHPALGTDLYLQNTSQDQYTIFSPFYASMIAWLGLENATLALTVLFIVCFLAAAWALARSIGLRDVAWLAVCALIAISGAYGGAGVFHFSDNYLSARLPAQALVLTALACHFKGMKRMGLLLATAALFVHPLMSLPGLLLLICLWLPRRMSIMAAIAGVLTVLGVALAARILPGVGRMLTVMDSPWLEVVHERSHFLFLQFWSMSDWELNARPFLCLTLTALSIDDERIRRLSIGALTVGAAGLAVAFIASVVAPIALLIQGQAWRWVWITDCISILLLAPTVLQVWRDEKCGPMCATLLICGWTVAAIDGTACVAAALILWLARAHITGRAAQHLRLAAVAAGSLVVAWALANSWTILTSATAESGREPLALARIRNILGLGIPAVLLIGISWHWIRTRKSPAAPAIAAAILFAAAIYILPKSFREVSPVGSAARIAEFADWRAAIPEASTVFVADKYDSGSFVWFTLGRPNYLSIDQSAGVVFSRATALEIRRRSEILLPLMDVDWKLFTIIRQGHSQTPHKKTSSYRPLTAQKLIGVCGDPQLGFVIAEENVGFDPIRHTHAGPWKGWNLYDCRRVRSVVPRA
jgi:hypothetical protein